MTKRTPERLQSAALPGNNLGQVVHTLVSVHQAVQFNTSQRKVMPRGWEDKHRSGVALPCVMNSVVYPPTGSMDIEMEMNTPPRPWSGTACFTFTLHIAYATALLTYWLVQQSMTCLTVNDVLNIKINIFSAAHKFLTHQRQINIRPK